MLAIGSNACIVYTLIVLACNLLHPLLHEPFTLAPSRLAIRLAVALAPQSHFDTMLVKGASQFAANNPRVPVCPRLAAPSRALHCPLASPAFTAAKRTASGFSLFNDRKMSTATAAAPAGTVVAPEVVEDLSTNPLLAVRVHGGAGSAVWPRSNN